MNLFVQFHAGLELDVDIIVDNLIAYERNIFSTNNIFPIFESSFKSKQTCVFPESITEIYEEILPLVKDLVHHHPLIDDREDNIKLRQILKRNFKNKITLSENFELKRIYNEFQKNEKLIIEILKPNFKIRELIIDVHISNYGLPVEASPLKGKSGKYKMEIYLRSDMETITILEGILFALIRNHFSYKIAFNNVISIAEFIMNTSIFRKNFSKYTSIYKAINLNNLDPKLLENHNHFNEKIKSTNKFIEISTNDYISKQLKIQNFTDKEWKILNKLLISDKFIVSYDTISEILWESTDNFSFWALSKAMQRIKDKLETSGISPKIIKNVRGKGYIIDSLKYNQG